ncbi:MAG: RIP metalloprotease RseP [Deltaproteobacteria bacterium]|nr:RIP metalloprotease RseP [Deltaproteobacteria bacterium]MCL5792659.1 RIP metalloprotease RseP [Deltaproteobacteria bacterium]
MVISIVAAVVVIAVLVLIHELGHFTFAKLFNIKVLAFSLGFGPVLLKKKLGETEYRLSLLPLGGYVKMLGEDVEEPVEKISESDNARSFVNQSNWKKFLVLFAGPFSNWLFALLILWMVFIHGMPYIPTIVGDVKKNSPAYTAGIQKGDEITAIDRVKTRDWEQMTKIIRGDKADREVTIDLTRNGKTVAVKLKPELESEKNMFGENMKVPVIGIMSSGEVRIKALNAGSAFISAANETWNITALVVVSLEKLVEGKVPAKDLGGPILIAQQAGRQAKKGVDALLFYAALISINFALLNILPIPVLDGGNIMFTAIEAVIRRPLSKKVKLVALQFGLVFIVLLMVFAFYNDINRIIVSHHH